MKNKPGQTRPILARESESPWQFLQGAPVRRSRVGPASRSSVHIRERASRATGHVARGQYGTDRCPKRDAETIPACRDSSTGERGTQADVRGPSQRGITTHHWVKVEPGAMWTSARRQWIPRESLPKTGRFRGGSGSSGSCISMLRYSQPPSQTMALFASG